MFLGKCPVYTKPYFFFPARLYVPNEAPQRKPTLASLKLPLQPHVFDVFHPTIPLSPPCYVLMIHPAPHPFYAGEMSPTRA